MGLFSSVTDDYFEYLMCQELDILRQEEMELNFKFDNRKND